MKHARQKKPRHNLTRLRLLLGKSQREMADAIGCSFDTIQSIELERLRLSEELARRISAATDVHLHWLLENDLEADIVDCRGHPYSRRDFEQRQATQQLADNELSRALAADYAASFYGQIRAILSSASKTDLAEVATWKIAKFLDDCRREFGHDKRLIGTEEQFGLRAADSPYLKFRQINAGISLFRSYDRDRKRSIAKTLAQLKKTRRKQPRSK
jgi:transcriptional regulator with XRE-family HTH domain